MTLGTTIEERHIRPILLVEIDFLRLDTSGPSPVQTIVSRNYSYKFALNIGPEVYSNRIAGFGAIRRFATTLSEIFEKNRFQINLKNSDMHFTDLLQSQVDGFVKLSGSEVRFKVGNELVASTEYETFFTGKITKWGFSGGKLNLDITDVFNEFPELTQESTIGTSEFPMENFYVNKFKDGQVPYIFGTKNGVSSIPELLNKGTFQFMGYAEDRAQNAIDLDVLHVGFLRACEVGTMYRNFPDLAAGTENKVEPNTFRQENARNKTDSADILINGLNPQAVVFDTPADNDGTIGPLDVRPDNAAQDFSFDTVPVSTTPAQYWDPGPDTQPVSDTIAGLIRGIIQDLCGLDFFTIVDSASWTAFRDTAIALNYKASGQVILRQSPASLLQDVCDEFNISITQNPDNKLEFFIADLQYSIDDINNPVKSFTDIRDVMRGSFKYEQRDESIINRVDYHFNKHHFGNTFISNDAGGNIRGTTQDGNSVILHGELPIVFDYDWIGPDTVAGGVSSARVSRRRYGEDLIFFSLPLNGFNLRIFDIVNFQHFEMPLDSTFSRDTGIKAVAIQRIVFNPTRMQFDIVGREVSASVTERMIIAEDTDPGPICDEDALITIKGIVGASAEVTNGVSEIVLKGIDHDIAAKIFPDDIITLTNPIEANERANKKQFKCTNTPQLVTPIPLVFKVPVQFRESDYTDFVTEVGLDFQISKSWVSATSAQKQAYGFIANSLDKFSNGDQSTKFFV